MEEQTFTLIDFIEMYDWTPMGVQASVKRASRILRRRRGQSYRGRSKAKRYIKNQGNRRVRRYFKHIVAGKRPPKFRPVSGRDIV